MPLSATSLEPPSSVPQDDLRLALRALGPGEPAREAAPEPEEPKTETQGRARSSGQEARGLPGATQLRDKPQAAAVSFLMVAAPLGLEAR